MEMSDAPMIDILSNVSSEELELLRMPFSFLSHRFGLKTEELNGGVRKDFHLLSETLRTNVFHTDHTIRNFF